jgi:hypothetical protein
VEEKWLGSIPKIEMNYDPKYRFILTVTITVDAKESFATEEDLVKILLQVIHSFIHSIIH